MRLGTPLLAIGFGSLFLPALAAQERIEFDGVSFAVPGGWTVHRGEDRVRFVPPGDAPSDPRVAIEVHARVLDRGDRSAVLERHVDAWRDAYDLAEVEGPAPDPRDPRRTVVSASARSKADGVPGRRTLVAIGGADGIRVIGSTARGGEDPRTELAGVVDSLIRRDRPADQPFALEGLHVAVSTTPRTAPRFLCLLTDGTFVARMPAGGWARFDPERFRRDPERFGTWRFEPGGRVLTAASGTTWTERLERGADGVATTRMEGFFPLRLAVQEDRLAGRFAPAAIAGLVDPAARVPREGPECWIEFSGFEFDSRGLDGLLSGIPDAASRPASGRFRIDTGTLYLDIDDLGLVPLTLSYPAAPEEPPGCILLDELLLVRTP